MDSPPLLKVFTSLGVFPFKYNRKAKCYQKRSDFLNYAIIITIIIQTFNLISFCYRMSYIMQYFLKISEFSLTSKVVLALDAILWLFVNIGIMFQIILKSNGFCQVLNHHLYSDRKFITFSNDLYRNMNILFQNRFGSISKSFILVIIIGVPVNVLLNYKIEFIAYFTLFSHYLVMVQCLFGHLYELMLVERSVGELQLLQSILCSKLSDNLLRFYLQIQYKCHAFSKRTMKVFQMSQVVCVASVLILFSIYLFLKYECLVKGSFKRQICIINLCF